MQLPTALILAFAALSASAPTKDAKPMSQMGSMCREEDGLCNEASRNNNNNNNMNWLQNERTTAHLETDGIAGSKMAADGHIPSSDRMANGRMNKAMTAGAQLSGNEDAHLLWHGADTINNDNKYDDNKYDDKKNNDKKNDGKATRSYMAGHRGQDSNQHEHAQQLDETHMLGIRSHMQLAAAGAKQQQQQQPPSQWEGRKTVHMDQQTHKMDKTETASLQDTAGPGMFATHAESSRLDGATIKTTRDLPMDSRYSTVTAQAHDADVVRASAFFSRYIADVAQLQTCDAVFGAAQTARSCMAVRSTMTGDFIMTCQEADDDAAGLGLGSGKVEAGRDVTSCIMYPSRLAQQKEDENDEKEQQQQQQQKNTKQQKTPRAEIQGQWIKTKTSSDQGLDDDMSVKGNLDAMPLDKVAARGELCPMFCNCAQFAQDSLEQHQCATNAHCLALGCSFTQ